MSQLGQGRPPEPPSYRSIEPAPAASGPPGVWTWFIVYCVLMALLYVATFGLGLVYLLVDPREFDMDPTEARIVGGVMIGIAVVLSLVGLAATLLLAVTFVVAWPTIRQLVADRLVATLGVSDQSGRHLAGVGIGLLVAAAVVGPWLVRVAVSFSWRSLRDWVAARVAALRSPAA